jgi:hypothetical protein
MSKARDRVEDADASKGPKGTPVAADEDVSHGLMAEKSRKLQAIQAIF